MIHELVSARLFTTYMIAGIHDARGVDDRQLRDIFTKYSAEQVYDFADASAAFFGGTFTQKAGGCGVYCRLLCIWQGRSKPVWRKPKEEKMINFEEELKKFHPSLEIEDAADAIYNQDLTDMADVLVGMLKEAKEEE